MATPTRTTYVRTLNDANGDEVTDPSVLSGVALIESILGRAVATDATVTSWYARLDSVLVLASVATSIDSVKYTDADGNETTLASTDYSIDDTDAPTVLLLDPVPTVELARVRNPVVVAYQSALDDRQVIATALSYFNYDRAQTMSASSMAKLRRALLPLRKSSPLTG